MACEDLPRIVSSGGQTKWKMVRDKKGYRTYSITHRVEVDRTAHGPLSALEGTAGLPEPGASWSEPDIIDEFAYFTQEATVEQVGNEAGNCFFDITQTATSNPSDFCSEEFKDDPLAIADRVKIESVERQKEATFNRDGDAITNSAYEQYRGSVVEFDDHKIRVVIEQNAAELELDLIDSLMNTVNDAPLWDFDAGCVKFSRFETEPKYHTDCQKYWLRRMTFDVDTETFTRTLLDEGTKVLHGRWDQLKGTGCIVTLSAVTGTGGITAVAIMAGGSGYPKSCIVPLKVGSGGTGGIVLVETNSSGVVTSFVRVQFAGTGYTNGDASTTQRGYWVLTRFNGTGEAPIHTNPQHFDRPGEIRGQNTRFILDGKGMPISNDEDPGEISVDYYPESNLLLLGIPLSLETVL